MFSQQRVKKLILCKGQVFGEDECLKAIFYADNYPKGLLDDSIYAVTCDSTDAEVLVANVKTSTNCSKTSRDSSNS